MLRKFSLLFYYLFRYPYYKLSLGSMGARTKLHGTKLSGGRRIFIGSRVFVNDSGWLAAEPLTGDQDCALRIGDGTYIGRFCHIYATASITIGTKVLLADKVYISDNLHGFEDVGMPVIDQALKQTEKVSIGDGAWLGENVCVIGASVGRQSVIGANAVVTSDIPDYCVAVGIPARIVKRYDHETKCWRRTNEGGEFLT